jgi:3-deoxy-D-manno-octulosonic-acid transferase
LILLYKTVTFLIYYISLPFLFIAYLGGSITWGQRLGFLKSKNRPPSGKCDIWLHASSMGEVKVLEIIVNELIGINKSFILHVTVMTQSGYNLAQERLSDKASISFFPLDYRSAIRRFLKAVGPKEVVFIETEIWPNIILELSKRIIPIFLANGRLSDKATGRYAKFKSAIQKVLRCYQAFIIQSENDKERFVKLGAEPERILVLGNLKLDAPPREINPCTIKALRDILPFEKNSRIFIAGSTRKEENDLVLECYKKIKTEMPDIKLIIVPRHLERVEAVSQKAAKIDLNYILYSRLEDNKKDKDVLIVDRMGVLNDLYSISDIAFVGGTLADIGGQNILEPVWNGIPVLFGPFLYNVRDSSDYIIQSDFGEMVENIDDLCNRLMLFFRGEKEYKLRSPEDNNNTRVRRTVQIILDGFRNDAKSLA